MAFTHSFIFFTPRTLTSKIVSCPSLAILKIILKFQHTHENTRKRSVYVIYDSHFVATLLRLRRKCELGYR